VENAGVVTMLKHLQTKKKKLNKKPRTISGTGL